MSLPKTLTVFQMCHWQPAESGQAHSILPLHTVRRTLLRSEPLLCERVHLQRGELSPDDEYAVPACQSLPDKDRPLLNAGYILGDITNPITTNRYIYCIDNPLNYKDPSGYEPTVTDVLRMVVDYTFYSDSFGTLLKPSSFAL